MTSTLKKRLQIIRKLAKDELQKFSPLIENLDCGVENLQSEKNSEMMLNFSESVQLLSEKLDDWMVRFAGDVIKQATEICGLLHASSRLSLWDQWPRERQLHTVTWSSCSLWKTKTVTYFEELAVTAYFIIGHLQETELKYMNIEELNGDKKWFYDASVSGFKIDGLQENAGHIPTGNGSQSQKNKFIQTVDGLVKVYKQIFLHPDPEKSKIGDLSAMLSSTVLLYGESRLHDDFATRVSAVKPSALRSEASLQMLQSDAAKFDHQPDDTLTHIKEVKKDFY